MNVIRQSTLALLTTTVLLVSACSPGGTQVTTEADPAHGAGESEQPTAAAAQVADGARAFSEAVATAPYSATSDYGVVTPQLLADKGQSPVLGTIVDAKAGEPTARLLNTDDGNLSFKVNTLTVLLSVETSDGSIVDVAVPVYEGPDEFLDRAKTEHVDPIVKAVPVGASVVAFVDLAAEGTVAGPTPPTGVFVADASGVYSLAGPGDGTVLGADTPSAIVEQLN